jgi:hypothetical protein
LVSAVEHEPSVHPKRQKAEDEDENEDEGEGYRLDRASITYYLLFGTKKASGYRLPATGYRLPATGYRLLAFFSSQKACGTGLA